jgi:hypothetical protein
MKSIDFPQANIAIAKDQPQYRTLYAHLAVSDPMRRATCCMRLTPEEIEEINKTGCLWITQCTFGNPYAPLHMDTKSPFGILPANLPEPMNENRTIVEAWDNTHFRALAVEDPCTNCGKAWQEHWWSTRQCKL